MKKDEVQSNNCKECDGTGRVCYSCCGDDIKGNDIDLCPTCGEHCGMEEEDCDGCKNYDIVKIA